MYILRSYGKTSSCTQLRGRGVCCMAQYNNDTNRDTSRDVNRDTNRDTSRDKDQKDPRQTGSQNKKSTGTTNKIDR